LKLEEYKLIILAVGLIGVLIAASPLLAMNMHLPSGEKFSELYVLGPGHMAEDYPFNIAVGQNYSIYAGVGNHLGSSAYYVLYVKLQNKTDPMLNSTTATLRPFPALCEFRFVIPDDQYWEIPLTFTLSNVSISGNQSLIRQLLIDNVSFDVSKQAVYDSNSTTFDYRLLFELWLYDVPSNSVQFNNRFVYLQLNVTKSI
jgi:uncharacterized membrane protein